MPVPLVKCKERRFRDLSVGTSDLLGFHPSTVDTQKLLQTKYAAIPQRAVF